MNIDTLTAGQYLEVIKVFGLCDVMSKLSVVVVT